MTNDQAISSESGCLATFVSVSAVSLLLTLSMLASWGSIPLFVLVFIVTTIIVVPIGLTLYGVALHFGWANIWVAMASGAITGVAVPLVSALSDGGARAWHEAAAYALIGSIGGLIFFLTATAPRNPARNLAVLLAIVGVSAALTPLLSALLS